MSRRRRSTWRGWRATHRTGLVAGLTTLVCLVGAEGALAYEYTSAPPTLAATAGDALTGGTGAAEDPQAQSSRRFEIQNLSGYTLKLDDVQGDKNFEGRPDLYSTMGPGQKQGWEVQYVWWSVQNNNVFYDVYDFEGRVIDRLETRMTLNGNGYVTTSSWSKLTNNRLTATTTNDGRSVVLKDAKQGTYEYGPNQPKEQAAILNNVCNSKQQDVDCTFRLTSNPAETERSELLGIAWANRMSTPFQKTVTTEKTQTVTDAIEISASAKANVYKVVELQLGMKLGRTWVTSEKYSQTLSMSVPPNTKIWQTGDFPMLRYTGDFTVKVGGTTYVLKDVSFEAPDPNPKRQAQMTWREAQLNDSDTTLRDVQQIPSRISLP